MKSNLPAKRSGTGVNRRTAILGGMAGAAALMGQRSAFAQKYPSRPITIVVPYSPGGSTDVIARVIASKLNTLLDGVVIVENKPGAAGAIGAVSVARAKPDGYTFLIAPSGITALLPLTVEPAPFGPDDFAPVASMHTQPLVLVARSNGGYRSLDELRTASKAGKWITMGESGLGNTAHYCSFQLGKEMEIQFSSVPYKGGAPQSLAILNGEVDLGFLAGADAAPQIESGAMRALLVSTKNRSAVFPDVPPLSQFGLNEPDIESWNALYAPRGVPDEAVAKVGAAVATIYGSGALDKFLAGSEKISRSPAEIMAHLKSDTEKFRRFVQLSGFRRS